MTSPVWRIHAERLRAAWWLLPAIATWGCTPSPPPPPQILVVATVAEIRIAEPLRTFVLSDGRQIEISTATTRVLFEGGIGQPLVHGRDGEGAFIAVFTSQGALPADCHLPGIGNGGTDWGTQIEIAGVLWPKAATFHSTAIPILGGSYPSSMRFCFNEAAEVAYTIT